MTQVLIGSAKRNKRMGRPPKYPGSRLARRVMIRLPDAVASRYQAEARKAGVSLSDMIRITLEQAK